MLIIDMPMPKFCIWRDDKNEPHRCPLLNEDDNCVPQDSNIWMGWNEQYAHCPIKGELPDEHGDLVDADTVLWEVPDSEGIVPPMPVTIGDVIEGYDVPIVIAAERKDDEQIH